MFKPITKEIIMKKFLKVLTVFVVVAVVAVIFGTQVVQALREWAAPEPLPYGLTMQDTMESVEQRLGQPKVVHVPQAGWEPGLPDFGGSPDHAHYYAVYKRFGVTVVYNSPFPGNKNATIKSIIAH
jgi:hypothetical protein